MVRFESSKMCLFSASEILQLGEGDSAAPSFCQMVSITGVPATVQRNLAALPTKVVTDLGLERKLGGYASVKEMFSALHFVPTKALAVMIYFKKEKKNELYL